ncbi:unnamed protein product [marine sediment metagenome]|uniref:Uncharacterized protein n=1 Tax=marine sediment metagenome TaxID=412755 RepID=X1NC68_9ZZZZ
MYNSIKIPDIPEKDSEVMVSSEIIQAKQEAQMASELRDIKKLIAKLLTKNSKKELFLKLHNKSGF